MAKASDKSTQAIIEAANEWLLVMYEERRSLDDEQAFVAWLRGSPVHVREYLKAEAVFATLEEIDSAKRIDVEALLAADDDSVIELGAIAKETGGRPFAVADRRRRAVWPWAAAASVVLAAVLAFWYSTLPQVELYTTGLGEQRRLVLEDGSVIDMNTQSILHVALTDEYRNIKLDQGEALFTVAKDRDRPFIVESEFASVRAIGTQFNVQHRSGETLVTVLEGRVAVEQTTSHNQSGAVGTVDTSPIELGAGDEAEVVLSAPIKTQAKVNTERTLAWTERRLIFENETLSTVVAEFNRYNPRQLIIDDNVLGQERISAVFDADKPDALLRFLEQSANIMVQESQTQLIIQTKE